MRGSHFTLIGRRKLLGDKAWMDVSIMYLRRGLIVLDLKLPPVSERFRDQEYRQSTQAPSAQLRVRGAATDASRRVQSCAHASSASIHTHPRLLASACYCSDLIIVCSCSDTTPAPFRHGLHRNIQTNFLPRLIQSWNPLPPHGRPRSPHRSPLRLLPDRANLARRHDALSD